MNSNQFASEEQCCASFSSRGGSAGSTPPRTALKPVQTENLVFCSVELMPDLAGIITVRRAKASVPPFPII
eukprot:scaffold120396_cov19-Tisochrysis_lutea.AAC.2